MPAKASFLLLAVLVAGVLAAAAEAEPPLAYLEQWWTWPQSYSNQQADAANAAVAAAPANASTGGGKAAGTAAVTSQASKTSVLWGSRGERWSPSGPLMDFSYAGYMQGSVPIPSPPITKSFRSFQRPGMSDTAALLAALAWAHKQPHTRWVVIGLPAGTIRLDRQLHITRPRLILRGAGSGATTLRIDRPLKDTPGVPKMKGGYGYYNMEAFIMVTGRYLRDGRLTTVTGQARRGDRRVTVASASRISAGQYVVLILSDKRGVLTRYLMNNRPLDIGRTSVDRYMAVRFPVRVMAVRGKTLVLERPLPFDVRPEFFPEVLPQSGTVHDVGVEGLRFQFPFTFYGGHHYEAGFNMIQFWEVYNCWARDVHGHNVDNGIFVHKSSAVQINGLRITETRSRNPKRDNKFGSGHWGVHNGGTADLLVRGFDIQPDMLHAVGSDAFGMYAVFSQGRMANGNLELHRALSHALFTDIDVGIGDHALQSGGPSKSGPNTQAWTAFWNIRSRRAIPLPGANGTPPGGCQFGPDLSLVGLKLDLRRRACPYWLIETGATATPNLYRAQLALRRARDAARKAARAG